MDHLLQKCEFLCRHDRTFVHAHRLQQQQKSSLNGYIELLVSGVLDMVQCWIDMIKRIKEEKRVQNKRTCEKILQKNPSQQNSTS